MNPRTDQNAFVSGASITPCGILFNRAWRIRAWYQKPAHFEDAEGFPQWYDFLKKVTPSAPYFVDGTPQDWSPVQYYNTKWKPRYIEQASVCFLLDQGESVALGVFQPDAKGKNKRRARLQKEVTGILLDVDEGIPPDIATCDDLIEAVPFLKYATGIRESVSSRSERKGGLSQFRSYFGLEKPIPVDCERNKVAVRAREKLGEWLAARSLYAPEGLAKNAVCVGYGNAGTLSKYDSDYLISDDFVQEITREAEAEIAAETQAKKRQDDKRQKRYRILAGRKKDGKEGDTRSPIEAFIEDEDPIRYMERQGWITHSQGSEYHWHESSTAGRSCLIENGIIKPFSATLQGASPANETPVNAHRFILYYETELDIARESDRPEIRKILADRGYGMSIEAFKRQRLSIPPLSEVLRAEDEAMQRAIDSAPPYEDPYSYRKGGARLEHATDAAPDEGNKEESKPETLQANRAAREKATDTFLTSKPEKDSLHTLLVKDSTGTGKSHTIFTKAKSHGKRPLVQMEHSGLAKQAVNIAYEIGFKDPCHLEGREHNWRASGIAEIPLELRTEALFSENNCIRCDEVEKYREKRIAPRIYCELKCPELERDAAGKIIKICPHLAQYQNLGERDFIATCTPNLLFDLNMRGYLKTIVNATDDPSGEELAIDAMMGTESTATDRVDFAILDDYGINALFSDVTLKKSEFKALKKAWRGTPTADFAKQMLKAFEKKKPQKILKALRSAFERTAEHHKEIAKELTLHARKGTIHYAELPKASKETRRTLAEKEVRFDDGGRQFIPVNYEAYKELTDKNIPCTHPRHRLHSVGVDEEVRVPYSPTHALATGVPLKAFTPVWQEGVTPIEIIGIFLGSIGNDKNAPIHRSFLPGDTPDAVLTFSIPPQAPVGILPQIALLSATTDPEETTRLFDGQAVTFSTHEGGKIPWADGVNVYQFTDARLTSASVFAYSQSADGKRKLQETPIGLTPTASKRLAKLNDWAKAVEGVTAFVSYKEFTEQFCEVVDGFNIVTHFDKVTGLNFTDLKFLVVFGYPKVKHEIVMEQARKQYASDNETLPKATPELRDDDGKTISEYMQLTEEATRTENGVTSTERRYKDDRLEKIRHQLATEKLDQALGRARLPVWTDTETIIFTAAPVKSITERSVLFSGAAFNLAETPSALSDAMDRIQDAEGKGDVEAVMETKGVSKRQAYRVTKEPRRRKAEKDAALRFKIEELLYKGWGQRGAAKHLEISLGKLQSLIKKG